MDKFENIIWQRYGEDKRYPRIRHNLIQIRKMMYEQIPFFKGLSVLYQLQLCEATSLVATDTVMQHINEHWPLSSSDTTKIYQFSQNWGYTEPETYP